jgi:hypothetical protein
MAAWRERGVPRAAVRWLERELDTNGVPRRLPVSLWWPALALLNDVRRRHPRVWTKALNTQIEGFVRAALRFSRPDASACFGEKESDFVRETLLSAWAAQVSDPAIERVVRWWFPNTQRRHPGLTAPPLPAYSCSDRALAVLRPDWTERGDLIAIDQRDPAKGCLLELRALGHSWLGPGWESGSAIGRARPVRWMTGPYADYLEWSFQAGSTRVIRSAILLRGRQLALLAEQHERIRGGAEIRLEIAPGCAPEHVPGSRAVRLGAGRSSVRILPLGLPPSPYPTDRGSFDIEENRVVLRHNSNESRLWMPLLISWAPGRNRKDVRWRVLTVSEKSRAVPQSVAFAVRVSWGLNDTIVIYRSLARPGLRAFLGHHTRSQFLIAEFSRQGDIYPLLEVEDKPRGEGAG